MDRLERPQFDLSRFMGLLIGRVRKGSERDAGESFPFLLVFLSSNFPVF